MKMNPQEIFRAQLFVDATQAARADGKELVDLPEAERNAYLETARKSLGEYLAQFGIV